MWPAENIMQPMWPAELCRFPTPALGDGEYMTILSYQSPTTLSESRNIYLSLRQKRTCNTHTSKKTKNAILEKFLRQRDCERPHGYEVKQPP